MTLYSADEVAAMLGLHVRTIRTYVRDGRLPAVKIGKQYRIAATDVAELTEGLATTPSGAAGDGPPRVEVTAVVALDDVDDAMVSRLRALVGGALASRGGADPPLHAETTHDPGRRTAKVVAVGGAADTAALIGLVGTLVEEGA